MKILLIRHAINAGVSVLGNGIGIIATILKDLEHEVRVIDNNTLYKEYTNVELLKIIKEYKPNIVAFSIAMANACETYELASLIKHDMLGLIVVGGGIHMKHCYKEGLDNDIDIVVNREGELVVGPLFDYLKDKNNQNFKNGLQNISGVSFMKDDGTIFLPEQYPILDDLDKVPLIDYDLFNITDYMKHKKEPGLIFIIGQRGCPFRCTFCSDEIQRQDNRVSSASWMFKNIQFYYKKYNTKYFVIADNNFSYPKTRAVELCNLIINSELNGKIFFSCQTKVETSLDDELLILMKKAGCKRIYLGLERLEEYSLKMIQKQSSKEKVDEIIKRIYSYNIEIGIFIMVGFPFETEELLKKEKKLFLSLKPYIRMLSCGILQPAPGTIYYDNYEKGKEWYLSQKALLIRKTFCSEVLVARMLGQLDLNIFNLSPKILSAVKEFYLMFREMSHGNYIPNQSIIFILMIKIELLLAKTSGILFRVSPKLERKLFGKIKALRYYIGTYFFGNKIVEE